MSYSHENAAWFKRLLPVLRVKANVDAHQPCTIQNSKPGTAGTKRIQGELQRMDIFLCLVSYQFLASGYIKSVELPIAKERHKNGESRWWRCFFIVRTSSTTANFSISSIRYLQGARAGGISKKTATGTTRFILSDGLKEAIEKARARPGRYGFV